jgi:undecaprenyl-diphosphatase
MCWQENRSLDIAVHVGTLFSVLLYFRRDLWAIQSGILAKAGAGLKLPGMILLASFPVIVAGLAVEILKPSLLCLLTIMAWATLIFGIVLWIADRFFPAQKTLQDMTWRRALLIGLAQVLALIPGTSRSGITMTTARFFGFSRTESARFSMLLAIVAICGAGALAVLESIRLGDLELGLNMLVAAVLSFITGYAAITLMMKWLERSTFTPFAIYRVALGTLLLVLLYSGVLA